MSIIGNVTHREIAWTFIRDQTRRPHIFWDKNSWNDLKVRSRSSATARFNRPHITFCYYRFWNIQRWIMACLEIWYVRGHSRSLKMAQFDRSLRPVYSDTTQLNSTDPIEQRTTKSVMFLFMMSRHTNWVNWVTTFIDRWQLFTLWTCRQLDLELSWVELCRYKHLFSMPL